MVTRRDLGMAGLAAILTAGLVTASLVLFGGGPPSPHPNAVLDWYADHALRVQVSALLWLLGMLMLVAFAIGFREAMWATVADRSWITVLFVQGAGVFATVAVVSSAVAWALASQAAAGNIGAELATTVWGVERTMLRFATWGLTAPMLVVSLALYRHSTLGQLCALAAVLVSVGLLVPLTWAPALYAFAAWLALTGATLLVPSVRRAPLGQRVA